MRGQATAADSVTVTRVADPSNRSRSLSNVSVWLAGIELGLATMPSAPALGIKRLLLPTSYWRQAEFAYVWRQLHQRKLKTILDVGSPKELAFFLARRSGYQITAVDILESEIEKAARYARARPGRGGSVSLEVQDARRLSYPDASFDAIYSVSVLEHIPADGDSRAMREFIRVVKPGGVIVVTVPFARKEYDTLVQHTVYERQQVAAEPVFFERHYDEASLSRRLLDQSEARVVERELWGERLMPAEKILERVGPARSVLSPLEPLLATLCLRRLPPTALGRAMAAFFTLEAVK